ncbi:hypothetical protein [Streptomyces acidiscabies]|uniref:hypothetical protein n=1 Tax=Streptomyces acidiscabies TaxID=42234 RepID=UPI0038F739AB
MSRRNPPDPQNPPDQSPKVYAIAIAYIPAVGLPGIPVGTLVRDAATGRRGTLRDVFPYEPLDARPVPGLPARPPRLLAFIRPVGGGREWTTDPGDVVPLP